MTEEDFMFAHLRNDYSCYYLKELAPYLRDSGILVKRSMTRESKLELWEFTKEVKTLASIYYPTDCVEMRCLIGQ